MLNILHVKLSAKELRREGDTLDEYKIDETYVPSGDVLCVLQDD